MGSGSPYLELTNEPTKPPEGEPRREIESAESPILEAHERARGRERLRA